MRKQMTSSLIQPLTEADYSAVLALNAAHTLETGPLDREELADIIDQAFYAREVGGGADAFLIAMDQDAAYESPNFDWFKARYPRFLYVDRIIIASHARRRGLARGLYEDLFVQARRGGHEIVACEVNIDPPNPASDALHAALGFEEVGQAVIYGGAKVVRYFVRRLM